MSNVSSIALSIALVREGHEKIELGVSQLAAGMVEAWATPMRAVVNEGRDNEAVYFFSFSDMFAERKKSNDDDKVEGRFLPAAYLAVAENFGIDGGLTTKDKQAFKRASRIAGAKLHMGVDVSFTPTGAAFPIAEVFPVMTTETVRVEQLDPVTQLPVLDPQGAPLTDLVEVVSLTPMGEAMVEKIKETTKAVLDTDLTDDEAKEKLLARKVVVNGKADAFVGEVTPALSEFASKFAAPLTDLGFDNFKPRAPRDALDRSAEFDNSVKLVMGTIAALVSSKDEGESDVAPTPARNAAMVKLADAIEDYLNSPLVLEMMADEVLARMEAERLATVQPDLLDEQPASPAAGKRPAKGKASDAE